MAMCRWQLSLFGTGCLLAALATRRAVTANELPSTDPPAGDDYNVASCGVRARNAYVYETIHAIRSKGAHLIDYEIVFSEYGNRSIFNESDSFYSSKSWRRVFTHHGLVLLALDFNYAAVSLRMLAFGVYNMTVAVVDTPTGCFQWLPEADKVTELQRLITNDFRVVEHRTEMLGSQDRVCVTVLVDDGGYADFRQQCCKISQNNQTDSCADSVDDSWIGKLYAFVALTKGVFLLFGPLLLQRWLFQESVSQSSYVVALRDTLCKTILFQRGKPVDTHDTHSKPSARHKTKKFAKFRRFVKTEPTPFDHVISVAFRKINLHIDERKLITETSVPAGVIHYLYHSALRLGNYLYQPAVLRSQDGTSGDCWTRARWFGKAYCAVLMHVLWLLVLVVLIPLPYIVRVVLFYLYEADEVSARHVAAAALRLRTRYRYNPLRYLTPTHSVMVTIYVAYTVSFAVLALSRAVSRQRYETIVLGAVGDLRAVSPLDRARLLASHLRRRCEPRWGALVAVVYWPLAVPVCALALLGYCVPTLYLSGRLLVGRVPPCCRRDDRHAATRTGRVRTVLSGDETSGKERLIIERAMRPPSPARVGASTRHWRVDLRLPLRSTIAKAVIKAACVTAMTCLLLLYAEATGFLLEVALLTLTGIVVNAGSAAQYAMLAFWVVTYAATCFHSSYKRYQQLNSAIFAYIKQKLNDDILAVTNEREGRQKHTAFKYFSAAEIRDERVSSSAADDSGDSDDSDDSDDDSDNAWSPLRAKRQPLAAGNADAVVDKRRPLAAAADAAEVDGFHIERGSLTWHVRSLVLFVDRHDVPRIPRALFHHLCAIEAPGCPGPVNKSLLAAFGRLVVMFTFLAFVFVAVSAFGSSYDASSTSRMLLTVASGFLPFVVQSVLRPTQAAPDLNTYTFEGKVRRALHEFSQKWPAYDLAFERCERPASGHSARVVDLVITIDNAAGESTAGRNSRLSPNRSVDEVDGWRRKKSRAARIQIETDVLLAGSSSEHESETEL